MSDDRTPRLHDDLVRQGYSDDEVARLVRDGDLVRLRRGAYADPLPAEPDPTAAHLTLIRAVVRQLCDDAVVSHASAAVLHGLPTWADQLERVHVTRDRSGGGKHRRDLQVHGLPIPAGAVTSIDGIAVTDLGRTVLDLSCRSSLERGVAVGDAALRLGLRPTELAAVVEHGRRRHGIARARTVAELVTERSESPGESFSRVLFWQAGLPVPIPQFVVRDALGRFVARCDFGWPELGTVGEFDGKTKYGVLLRPGQSLTDAILEEKQREERIRELGWQVVRWQTRDLSRRSDLLPRLRAAFRRGHPLPA